VDEVVDQVGRRVDDAGRQRAVQRGMIERGGDQPLELADELMHALRRQIEREQLDGDRDVARRIMGAKHRSQRPGTNLMKNTKRSERNREPGTGSFRVQWRISSGQARSW